jgi:hypothetical protein
MIRQGIIIGTYAAGQNLLLDIGQWDGNGSPITFTYQWTLNDVPITGATSYKYVVQNSDLASTIQCQVTATNLGGSTIAIVSFDGAYVVPDDSVLMDELDYYVNYLLPDENYALLMDALSTLINVTMPTTWHSV